MPEARPLSEDANATMQTNSGAGLGTVTKLRSTTMAISAVAAVKAGPEIARQSNCMPCSRSVARVKRNLDGCCLQAWISRSILKRKFTQPARLPLVFDQMISIADCARIAHLPV